MDPRAFRPRAQGATVWDHLRDDPFEVAPTSARNRSDIARFCIRSRRGSASSCQPQSFRASRDLCRLCCDLIRTDLATGIVMEGDEERARAHPRLRIGQARLPKNLALVLRRIQDAVEKVTDQTFRI